MSREDGGRDSPSRFQKEVEESVRDGGGGVLRCTYDEEDGGLSKGEERGRRESESSL